MTNNTGNSLTPVLYLPHGGGPLPIMGDPGHANLTAFLKEFPKRLDKPQAILVVSAHWEAIQATITSSSQPEMLFDYYGFPPESYQIQYPAPGNPQLAKEIHTMIEGHGIPAWLDEKRGFDHGLYIPLLLMYPDAQIPCLQLSILRSLDPAAHIALGKSLAALRRKNVLVVGSGMSFHNLRAFFAPGTAGIQQRSQAFDKWLVETCTDPLIPAQVREERLNAWEGAPFARFCHPREDHLLPLHVCYGIASAETPAAEVIFNKDVMGIHVTGLMWG